MNRFQRTLVVALIGASVALSGCGGGAVSVRSNFTGPPVGSAPPSVPAPPGASAPKGLFAAGDGHVLLGVILGVMIFDGVSWAAERVKQAFANPDAETQAQAQPASPVERTSARPPTYSWVFNRQ